MTDLYSPIHDCRFCNLVSPNRPAPADQILTENNHYYAISSIGGFIPGWTLIFPKQHKLNLARDYKDDDFFSFANHVQCIVTEEYGNCVVFEHGANREGSLTSCGVNHAHLHIVPFIDDIEVLSQRETIELEWSRAAITDIAQLSAGQEYLFCANSFHSARTSGLLTTLTQPRSQFFRKILATAVGLSNFYDYKRYRFEEISSDSAERLRTKFLTATTA